jgi:hypothetical protein
MVESDFGRINTDLEAGGKNRFQVPGARFQVPGVRSQGRMAQRVGAGLALPDWDG